LIIAAFKYLENLDEAD